MDLREGYCVKLGTRREGGRKAGGAREAGMTHTLSSTQEVNPSSKENGEW